MAMAMMMSGLALIFAPVWVWSVEASLDGGKNTKYNKISKMKFLLDSFEQRKEGEGGEGGRAVSNDEK